LASKILDATSFYAGIPFVLQEKYYTTPLIFEEIKHIKKHHGAVNALIELDRLELLEPGKQFIEKVIQKAKQIGDFSELSNGDISVIALSLQLSGEIITDDFAVSNVAKQLGIKTLPVMTRGISKILQRSLYCIACQKEFDSGKQCPICGTILKKRLTKSESSSNPISK
jgi:UPF0271 protein